MRRTRRILLPFALAVASDFNGSSYTVDRHDGPISLC